LGSQGLDEGRSAAPGFRDAGNNGRLGVLGHIGNNGYSWSSGGSGINGLFLHFAAQYLDPCDTSPRGHGLLLRCLSE